MLQLRLLKLWGHLGTLSFPYPILSAFNTLCIWLFLQPEFLALCSPVLWGIGSSHPFKRPRRAWIVEAWGTEESKSRWPAAPKWSLQLQVCAPPPPSALWVLAALLPAPDLSVRQCLPLNKQFCRCCEAPSRTFQCPSLPVGVFAFIHFQMACFLCKHLCNNLEK